MRVVLFLTLLTVILGQRLDDCGNGNAGISCVSTFRYSITNYLQKPYFMETMKMRLWWRRTNFFEYMQEAVFINPDHFHNFTATFSSPYGFFIDALNGLAGNYNKDKTFWAFLNATGPLPVGVSSYFPKAGDRITFNFTNVWPQQH